MCESILEGTISAMRRGLAIQRKKRIICGVRPLPHPSKEAVTKHFNEWLDEHCEFKFTITDDVLWTTHGSKAFVTTLQEYLTHNAFQKIHKLHQYSDYLQDEFWKMYDAARKYIACNKDLAKLKKLEKKDQDKVEEPDSHLESKEYDDDGNESVYGRWKNSEEVDGAIEELLSSAESY